MSRPPKSPRSLRRRSSTSRPAVSAQIDGAARGNPGPAGVGALLTDESGHVLKEVGLYLGEATNNVAEACALLVALQEALALGCRRVQVSTDSELLAHQVSGDYRVKDKELQWLHALIRNFIQVFDRFEIRHVPREKNRKADRLANRAVTEYVKRHPRSPAPKSPAPLPDPRQPTLFG